MTLNPFVYGSASSLECFDESAPCTLEQTSMCVIKVATDNAAVDAKFPGQSEFVPWLVCMDSNDDPVAQCNTQNNVDSSAVNSCLQSDSSLVNEYLNKDANIRSTPTTYVNGKNVDASYNAIHTALCNADSSLSACSNELLPEDWEVVEITPVRGAVEV